MKSKWRTWMLIIVLVGINVLFVYGINEEIKEYRYNVEYARGINDYSLERDYHVIYQTDILYYIFYLSLIDMFSIMAYYVGRYQK